MGHSGGILPAWASGCNRPAGQVRKAHVPSALVRITRKRLQTGWGASHSPHVRGFRQGIKEGYKRVATSSSHPRDVEAPNRTRKPAEYRRGSHWEALKPLFSTRDPPCRCSRLGRLRRWRSDSFRGSSVPRSTSFLGRDPADALIGTSASDRCISRTDRALRRFQEREAALAFVASCRGCENLGADELDRLISSHSAATGSACFQAAMPPCRWHALASPASCAAWTAMAERSPKAQ